MDYITIILFFLFSIVPGIYLASKKYFLVVPNPKYNRFAFKLIYCIPALGSLTLMLSIIPLSVLIIFSNHYPHLVDELIYIGLLCPLLISIFLILFLKKYVIRTDVPFECQEDFFDHELYVFIPYTRIEPLNIVYPKKRYKHRELDIGTQSGNLVLNLKYLIKVNYTSTGGLVVREEALEIFQKNNLTGYRLQPVSSSKKSSADLDKKYHQIIPLCVMPSFSPKTIVRSGTYPMFHTLVSDNLFYYNSSVMESVSDFNVTFEYLGSNEGVPYFPQRLWIVSNKAMRILLRDLDQKRRVFIPVTLIDNEDVTQ